MPAQVTRDQLGALTKIARGSQSVADGLPNVKNQISPHQHIS
jgi:hypothetical protein